jgi:hypothetical protein
VVAWGLNTSGQTTVPEVLVSVVTIAGGFSHSLAAGNFLTWPSNQWVAVVANHDRVITLSGADPSYYLRIISLPGKGTLYQYANEGRGTAITSPNTWVADARQRVVFAPFTNEFGKPYTSFSYVASDRTNDSLIGTATLEIEYFLSCTQPPTQVSPTEAVLHGIVACHGLSERYWFEWRVFGALDWSNTAPVAVDASVGWTRVNVALAGLQPGELYQFRLVVSNPLGKDEGLAQFFTTGRKPVVWGQDWNGTTNVPPGLTNAVLLAAGRYHLLAADALGKVIAWGAGGNNNANNKGQTNVPAGLTNPLALAAGEAHSAAVKADGTLMVWGSADLRITNVPPSLTNAGANVFAVALGTTHWVAVKADGTAVAWGYLPSGQVPVPSGINNVVAVGAGSTHSVVLRADGTVVAWGDNTDDENDFGQTDVPPGLSNVVSIAAGFVHSLALKSDGTVVAWGAEDPKGNYNYGQAIVPAGLSNVVAVSAGFNHSLAIKADGTLVAWGDNRYGQTNVPPGFSNVVAVGVEKDTPPFWVGRWQ